MATASQVCAAYETRSGGKITAAQADRAVNFGQAAGPLPKGKPGGGKGAAHWEADHLVTHCLMLAVLSHEVPITEAAREAVEYLNFRPTKRLIDLPAKDAAGGTTGWREIPVRDLASNPLGHGADPILGYSLKEALTRAITEMAVEPKAWEEMELAATLFPHERVVQLSYTLQDGTIVLDYYEPPRQLQLDMPEPPKIAFRRTTTIPFEMLQMLADLLEDTQARQASSPPTSQPRGIATPPESDGADPSPNGSAPSGQPCTPERAQAETLTISDPNVRVRVRARRMGWPSSLVKGAFNDVRPHPS